MNLSPTPIDALQQIFPSALQAGFLPVEHDYRGNAKTYHIKGANDADVLVAYADVGKGIWEVSLWADAHVRRRWGCKAFWRAFYRIPFDMLGCSMLIAETTNPIVVSMLKREGWVPYAEGWWAIKRHMVRHLKIKEVMQ